MKTCCNSHEKAKRWFLHVFTLSALLSVCAQAASPTLQINPAQPGDSWIRVGSSSHTGSVLTLFASTNLLNWAPFATTHDALLAYPDLESPGLTTRFYRLLATPRASSDDWKNQVLFPADALRSTNSAGNVTWIKFAILFNEPARVYYQDSRKYLFHYDFATLRLPPFVGMSYAEFDAATLHRSNQQAVLGAVLYPPSTAHGEYGIQFVGLDAYTPGEIAQWFHLVKATVYSTNNAEAFYMPAFEQSEVARTNAAAFDLLGIPVDSINRWVSVNTCYSPGWAIGTLKYFPATEVSAAYQDGRLTPADILLTDGVPSDTPLVAGILSLTPSSPNSHTAILSQSFGIPFAYLPDAAAQSRAQDLDGHKVIVRATVLQGVSQVILLDVEGQLEAALEAALFALKIPRPINFMPKESFGQLWANTDTMVPTDIRYFGGKAANYGFLRRCIPTNCPIAIAFSFDLWDQFLNQTLPGGATLRSHIADRLAPYTNFPPDVVSLKTNLAAIRDLFTKTAAFNAAQQQAITNTLALFFNPQRKIRFRSSTNVEDSEHFTGAGLYDSYSGCLLDDLDADTSGPSLCDPEESNERGVFRAIQKVYASFYNDDACLERIMHRVDESKAAMGVLVHHSFPDEEELANGVALPTFNFSAYSTNLSGDMVTQLGAESVTNPDGSALPEIVRFSRYNSSVMLTLKQYSSRVPLGDNVMDWRGDYEAFTRLFALIGVGFRQFYPAKNGFTLDFEYKKDLYQGHVVKQVREVPAAPGTNTVACLINEPVAYSVLQAEGTRPFAAHRLKSAWNLNTRSIFLAASNVVDGIYTHGDCTYPDNGTLQTISGPLSSWPHASVSPSGATNFWTTGTGLQARSWQLQTSLTTNVSGAQPPVFTQADFPKKVTVSYATPMPTMSSGVSGTTTSETVSLQVRPEIMPGGVLCQRTLQSGSVTIETTFYWPKRPEGIMIYTAPLLEFVQTRITGLTADPITLTNAYSQTYAPGHHNFSEEFVFEPRLDPGTSPAALAQLSAANIQLIYAYWNSATNVLYALGFDQKFRPL